MLFALPMETSLKANVVLRVISKFIDIFLMILVGLIVWSPIGALAGFFYSLMGDAINFGPFHGQSVGKWLMGLQVVHVKTGRPPTLKESVIRNAPVGVATFFSLIPIWGWAIAAFVGIPLMVIEVYLMLSVDNGHRLGDLMAETEVIPVKKTG